MTELISLSEHQTIDLGIAISHTLLDERKSSGIVIFLRGDLGAGKTTLTKGIMKGLGYSGMVKSPTFNLIEQHETENLTIYHFDLYRLRDSQELIEIGISEYLEEDNSVSIFEWPENFQSVLPFPELDIKIEHADEMNEHKRIFNIESVFNLKL